MVSAFLCFAHSEIYIHVTHELLNTIVRCNGWSNDHCKTEIIIIIFLTPGDAPHSLVVRWLSEHCDIRVRSVLAFWPNGAKEKTRLILWLFGDSSSKLQLLEDVLIVYSLIHTPIFFQDLLRTFLSCFIQFMLFWLFE